LLYEGVLHIKHVRRHFRTSYVSHRTPSALLIVLLSADVVLLLLLYANYLNNFIRQVIGTKPRDALWESSHDWPVKWGGTGLCAGTHVHSARQCLFIATCAWLPTLTCNNNGMTCVLDQSCGRWMDEAWRSFFVCN